MKRVKKRLAKKLSKLVLKWTYRAWLCGKLDDRLSNSDVWRAPFMGAGIRYGYPKRGVVFYGEFYEDDGEPEWKAVPKAYRLADGREYYDVWKLFDEKKEE